MATVPSGSIEARNVLYDVAWHSYMELRENPENYHVRMTYDRGALELFLPSMRHHRLARCIDLLIGVWTEEFEVPICGLRQMTCRREDLAKGLEPDDCYYIQNEAKIRNKIDIDFAIDPPPDLAVEVEVSRSSVPKAPIYAALGVGELWRYDGSLLRIFELVKGQYKSCVGSVCFPRFPVAKVEEVLQQVGEVDDNTFKRQFRRWVRKTFAIDSGE